MVSRFQFQKNVKLVEQWMAGNGQRKYRALVADGSTGAITDIRPDAACATGACDYSWLLAAVRIGA